MKKLVIWTGLAAVLMIGGPWLALRLAGWNAMGACFLLFFGANPLFAAVCGAVAGKDMKRLWPLPIIVAGLYLAGVWLLFEMGESAFLLYSGGYLVIGAAAMLIRFFVSKCYRGRGKC